MPLIASDGSSLGSFDGEARKAEGPGAYGVVIQFEADHPKAPGFTQTLTGGRPRTTTGDIELRGFLCALETIRDFKEALEADPDNALMAPGDHFTIVLDSEYVLNSFNDHLSNWEANRWRTNGSRAIKHQVLWQEVADLRDEIGDIVSLVHQKGHTKRATDTDLDPFVEINDRADIAAGIASRAMRDTGYVPIPHPIVWIHNAEAMPERQTDIRKLTALAERILTRHGRQAAVEAFMKATHNTGIRE